MINMKKQSLYIIGAITFVFTTLLSCYEDKGNYEYHELEEVNIDTIGTGMLSEYAIMRYDTLRIAPNIYFEGELVTSESITPLDYMWTIFSANTGIGADVKTDTIGYSQALDTIITRKGGVYYVQLAVTNRHDGIRQFFRTLVSVSETFDGGWMVFYERADKPGYSDLSLIHNEWVKSGSKTNRIYKNLYSENNEGEFLPGYPVRCLDIAVSLVSGNNYIGLCTDQTLVGVSENGFNRALEFGEFFYQQPANEAPIWYGQHGSGVMSGQNSEICINDGAIYTNTYSFSATEGRTTKFGMPKRSEDEVGELAPWNAEVAHTLNYGVIVYDQTNKCFRYAAYNSSKLEKFAAQDETKHGADIINNTGMTMLFSDWGKGTTSGVSLAPHDYSIMAEGTNRYLIVTNFSSSAPTDDNICIGKYKLTGKCGQINNATTMAASNVGSFIYYGAGNKLYRYAYDAKGMAKAIWTASDSEEEVVCVRIMKYYHGTVYGYGMVPSSDNLVHIATWNEKTQKGHLYQYKIDPASGDLKTNKCYDYDIPGKVKDMAWKFSMQ